MLKKAYLLPILCMSLLYSCSSDDDSSIDPDDNDTEETVEEDEMTEGDEMIDDGMTETTEFLITEDMFTSEVSSFSIVSAELENGDTVDCYQLVFSSNPERFETGPFCPENDEDVAGLSFYDGPSSVSEDGDLRVWNSTFLADIEGDGFDIVNADGTVNVEDFSGSTANDPDTYSYCLDGSDQDLSITFLIPVTPVLADQVNTIEEVELVGVSVDGVPMNGRPPSATQGPAMMGGMGMMTNNDDNEEVSSILNIPSLDPCGGHNDPAGYYHWHFVPEVATQVLVNNNITEIECTNIEQLTSGHVLSGFAKDGFPIYAYVEEPAGLDECGGLTAPTDDFPEGVYHYVASTTVAPNIPACLVGVAVRNNFEVN